MADINIGDIVARIRVDTSQLQQGMQQAQQALAQFGQAKDRLITNLGSFQQALRQNQQALTGVGQGAQQASQTFQQFNQTNQQINQTFQTLNQTLNQTTTIIHEAREGAQGLGSAWRNVFQIAGGIGIATSIQGIVSAFKDLVAGAIQAASRLEQLRAQFTAFQGAQAAQATLDALFRTAQRLGVEFGPLATGFRQFMAATQGTAIEGEKAERVFTQIVTGMRAMGTTSDQVSRALLALQQMVSKGTVSQEELRQQLGEALPGAMNIAARALGVTTAELNKMIEKGMDATTFVQAFGNQIEQEFSGKAAVATNTLASAWQRFLNELQQFQGAMAGGDLINTLRDLANWSAKLLENLRKAREEQERSLGGPATQVPEDLRGMSPEITARQSRINELRGFLQEPGLGGVLIGRERMEQYRQELLELQKIQQQAVEQLRRGLQGERGAYEGYRDPISDAQDRMQKLLAQGQAELTKIDLSPFLTDAEKADEKFKSWDKTLKTVNDEFQKLGEGLRRTLLPTERRTPFDALITQIAGEKGLDPTLMRALIEQESGYDPRARSRAGALGLMQLMPGTARQYGAGGQEFDPEVNLRAGMSYFAELLKQFNGNVEKALTAYNAGPAGKGIPQASGENATFAQEVLARQARMTGTIPGQLGAAAAAREGLKVGAESFEPDRESLARIKATGQEYLRAFWEEMMTPDQESLARVKATGEAYLRAVDEEIRKREQANESLKRLERQYSMTADARREYEAAQIAAQFPQDEEIQTRAQNVQLLIEEREAMMSTFNAIKARTDAQREAQAVEERALQTARDRVEQLEEGLTGGGPFGESRDLIRMRQRLRNANLSEEGRQEADALLERQASLERLNYAMGILEQLANSVGNAWSTALMSIADGTRTVSEAFREMARSIMQSMIQIASQEAFKAIFRIGTTLLTAALMPSTGAIGGGTSLGATGASSGFLAGSGSGGMAAALAGGGGGIGGAIPFQHGGVVNRPTVALLGEGPPHTLPETVLNRQQMQSLMGQVGRQQGRDGGISIINVASKDEADHQAAQERSMGRQVIINEVLSDLRQGSGSQIGRLMRVSQQ